MVNYCFSNQNKLDAGGKLSLALFEKNRLHELIIYVLEVKKIEKHSSNAEVFNWSSWRFQKYTIILFKPSFLRISIL